LAGTALDLLVRATLAQHALHDSAAATGAFDRDRVGHSTRHRH